MVSSLPTKRRGYSGGTSLYSEDIRTIISHWHDNTRCCTGMSCNNWFSGQIHPCSLLQGKELFVKALSTLPNRVLLKAYQAKQADHDCIAHGVALALAEIESTEQYKDYLFAIYGQCKGELAVTKEQLDVLKELLDGRGLSDVEDDGGFHCAVYTDELVALTIVEGQTNQMKDVVESRVSWSNPDLRGEESSSDEDRKLPFMELLSSNDDPDFLF